MFKKWNFSNKCYNNYVFDYYYKVLDLHNRGNLKLRAHRASSASGSYLNKYVYVHQGKTWLKLKLTKYHIGHKLGMFAATKKPFFFRAKKKKGQRDSKR